MKFLRFLFMARMSFVLFAFTVLYLSASHRREVPVTRQQPPAGQQH
jgi:hypothetical protein